MSTPAIRRCIARSRPPKPTRNIWDYGQNVPDGPTFFEQEVERLGIAERPQEWHHNERLLLWVKVNRCYKYVPEWFLERVGMKIYDIAV